MKTLLREPLVHFLLLGAALFAVYAYVSGTPASSGELTTQIALTPQEVLELTTYHMQQTRRAPTPEEMNALVERLVQDEVLYREAMAMGIDKHDPVVKSHLAKKMRGMTEGFIDVPEPSASELQTWYVKNADKFQVPARASFRQVFFAADRRGEKAKPDAAEALTKLAGQGKDSQLAGTLGDPANSSDHYEGVSPAELTKMYGTEFVSGISKAAQGTWQGPIQSSKGWHLVFVDSYDAGGAPDFKEIEPAIKKAWEIEQRQAAWRKAYEAMRAKYTVTMPAMPAGVGATGVAVPQSDAGTVPTSEPKR